MNVETKHGANLSQQLLYVIISCTVHEMLEGLFQLLLPSGFFSHG